MVLEKPSRMGSRSRKVSTCRPFTEPCRKHVVFASVFCLLRSVRAAKGQHLCGSMLPPVKQPATGFSRPGRFGTNAQLRSGHWMERRCFGAHSSFLVQLEQKGTTSGTEPLGVCCSLACLASRFLRPILHRQTMPQIQGQWFTKPISKSAKISAYLAGSLRAIIKGEWRPLARALGSA